MRFRTFLTYLTLLPLSACTRSCNDYDNNEEFSRAQLPPYTETGANTLGCVLGAQTWTVLGKYDSGQGFGRWQPNGLTAYAGSYAGNLQLRLGGRMTGARNSKEFYDTEIGLTFRLADTLGRLRLLGADTARSSSQTEFMGATNFIDNRDFKSSARRPVRLLIRKLDQQQRTVSGTFSGMLYENRGPDSLAVADGRFDVHY
ncbi:MAG: hypothetical protein M3Y54_04875 [Bacteroidota bacterium]|nr:hypothetical protein [Bacteroidota bacterium]